MYGRPWTLAHMLFAIAVSLMDTYVTERFRLDKSVIQLFTVPTAFLLLFRCNIGYARFWEGRGAVSVHRFRGRQCLPCALGPQIPGAVAVACSPGALSPQIQGK